MPKITRNQRRASGQGSRFHQTTEETMSQSNRNKNFAVKVQ
jgi:hypothetical protein